ncbi:phosphoenolpyruvate--protein phosphotransferase [Corynebacterium sp. 153RC1]|uniref:phosphoenolpyruvate--protein phosphotransferase n=1 Tax=unclassified Corynebacterium TaxID=2624378 RepID=UPI00211C9500|nr:MULTISPECIES: phosphoenolpyruvate--protein phosphotransferase [unclassified Corynebacterium]MCQ9370739.1 phosphoenolpyruvate--protein phosphotransferase [Corynebacterium sp. 35RC1]MCQ9351548.1 phosphoenolpyruvate--protein phosphotransferase [Corynebacterium sp. 209RC1]MCQ9353917.1 phosphoenolpyruvate--protein phosphotransferase [Corynebacterium sp. 1222RC1]MCQ9355831.1 phosphoenolpyruvate--protein phosphotransferase [Corynebacterium sp. 122RC1]MCQ9358075.1 phosphoenolpyruvate--protein phosp
MNNVTSDTTIKGTAVVSGVRYAKAVWISPRPELPQAGEVIDESQREAELERFTTAAEAVAARLEKRSASAEGAAAEVLKATAGMVRDRGWLKAVKKGIQGGHPADYAVVAATTKFVTMFEAAGGVMAERTTDLRDIRDRVIAELRGEQEPGLPTVDEQVVLFADDLSPADTAALDTDLFVGLVTELGGPTSHTAIIARQLNVPCIVAVGEKLHNVKVGDMVLVDGALGTVTLDADPETALAAEQESKMLAERIAQWTGPAETKDGHRVQLLANVQDGNAARIAATQSQAEGIGLFRTEMCFLTATEEPSVEEQAAVYKKVLEQFPHSKVVVRSLDAGSDKPVAFASMADEMNPALGVRGLRVARANEALLTRQLDAIALAAKELGRGEDAPTWVMAPMVATAREAKWFAGLCEERGLIAGAMIEVPAASLMADKLMPYLHFVSIGTNDLTQYTMAADRMSPQLAYLTDPWQPAVLRLIAHTCKEGERTNTAVGVCGEAAADPLLACVLAGLGVNSLSSASTAIAGVGAQLSAVDFETCKRAAEAALDAEGATEARAAVREVIMKANA